MAGPFYNAIKGTTAGTPGTGAFTPNAASSGALAWSTVPTGWIGLVRFEEGTAWELQYSYWNGTTLSRSATAQFVSSSTGSGLTLTSAATAALVEDAGEIAPHPMVPQRSALPLGDSNTTITAVGMIAPVITGTASGSPMAGSSFQNEQLGVLVTSSTAANAQAGYSNTSSFSGTVICDSTAGRGGYEFCCRFGAVGTLPTGPRWFVGVTGTTIVGSTIEPSALVGYYAVCALDSTDTNFQLITNAFGTGAGTKIATTIPHATDAWYEVTLWSDPGSLTVKMLLFRLDTGAIWYGSTATDVPLTQSVMFPQCIAGLSSTSGTAIKAKWGGWTVRTGAG
jgi:hypothetical protein